MEQEQETKVKRPYVIVTPETHKRLKVLAAENQVSMGELITSLMDYWEVSKEAHS